VAYEDIKNIDWADVATRARANLGEERVAPVSERVRSTMFVIAADRPYRPDGFRSGVRPHRDENGGGEEESKTWREKDASSAGSSTRPTPFNE
jgi:hypothetical protein